MRSSCGSCEGFSMNRLEGSRWRLRQVLGCGICMGGSWPFVQAKRECRHFQARIEETQMQPRTWRVISLAAPVARAASFLSANRNLAIKGLLGNQCVGRRRPPRNACQIQSRPRLAETRLWTSFASSARQGLNPSRLFQDRVLHVLTTKP